MVVVVVVVLVVITSNLNMTCSTAISTINITVLPVKSLEVCMVIKHIIQFAHLQTTVSFMENRYMFCLQPLSRQAETPF